MDFRSLHETADCSDVYQAPSITTRAVSITVRQSGSSYRGSRQQGKPENDFEGMLIDAHHPVVHGMLVLVVFGNTVTGEYSNVLATVIIIISNV